MLDALTAFSCDIRRIERVMAMVMVMVMLMLMLMLMLVPMLMLVLMLMLMLMVMVMPMLIYQCVLWRHRVANKSKSELCLVLIYSNIPPGIPRGMWLVASTSTTKCDNWTSMRHRGRSVVDPHMHAFKEGYSVSAGLVVMV